MDDHTTAGGRIWPAWLVTAGLAVVALVALGVPLVSLLYVGVLLLCPLLMMRMHGGGHGHTEGPGPQHGHSHEGPESQTPTIGPSGATRPEGDRG